MGNQEKSPRNEVTEELLDFTLAGEKKPIGTTRAFRLKPDTNNAQVTKIAPPAPPNVWDDFFERDDDTAKRRIPPPPPKAILNEPDESGTLFAIQADEVRTALASMDTQASASPDPNRHVQTLDLRAIRKQIAENCEPKPKE
jgi:hypothetical protein